METNLTVITQVTPFTVGDPGYGLWLHIPVDTLEPYFPKHLVGVQDELLTDKSLSTP